MKRAPSRSARDLLDGLPPVEPGDVAVRRLRQRIIDSVSERQTQPKRPSRTRRRLALAGAFIISSAAIVLLWAPWHRGPDSFLGSVESLDGGPLLWARAVDDGIELLTLRDGAFRVAVRPHRADRRLIVRVPEGRIDDLGTVFEVRIKGGRTTDVRVSHGHVQLWFGTVNGVILGAGEVWEAPAPATAPPRASAPTTPATKDDSRSALGSQSAPPHRVLTRSPRRSDAFQPTTNDGAEDAAYLEVIELLRAGRRDEAQAEARDYVRRFPTGFRLTEMQTIAK